MSALVKTDAVVLKSMKYRDTSRIVTFYTRNYGKLRGIAKGARAAKNKFGTGLEPLSRVQLLLYHKEHRDLHLISQCDVRIPARTLQQDLQKMSTALACLELIDQVMRDGEQNAPVFRLMDETLNCADGTTGNPEYLLFAFKIRFAGLLGFAPAFDRCRACGSAIELSEQTPLWFDVARGACQCLSCRTGRRSLDSMESVRSLSAQAAGVLRFLQIAPLDQVAGLGVEQAVGNEIRDLLRSFLQYHIDHLKPLRSEILLSVAQS